jgi:tellurite methyltransferase
LNICSTSRRVGIPPLRISQRRHWEQFAGRAIAPDTFIRGSDPKAHPHYYCDLIGLATLFAGFELLSLTQEEQRRPGSWHWHILAERR